MIQGQNWRKVSLRDNVTAFCFLCRAAAFEFSRGFQPTDRRIHYRSRAATIEFVRMIQPSLRDSDLIAPLPWVETHG